ncbi:hypothetical protein [Balneatrix alpica]|uniref:hypothetical protein n=1 Tax=Balneatrix alpica TaxID=75684 RepID=UPI0027387D4A|nr:hypothetical protein [Balneatrix alpica]
MDCAAQSTKERQGSFLGHCFEVLQEQLCGNNREKIAFYMNCIAHLTRHDSLTTTQIRECDKSADEEGKKADKTYRQWLHDFRNSIESNQNRLQSELTQYGLTHFPTISYVSGVKGSEAYFFVSKVTSNTAEVFTSDGSADGADSDYSTIRYKTEKIRRPPWYLKVAAPLFKTQATRVIFALSALIGVFLILPLTIGYIYFSPPNDPILVALFALLLAASLTLTSPTIKILRLITRKITIVDSLRLPLSSVCISEITRVTANDPSTAERRLSVVTVSANCPICNAMYGLESSVLLEQKGLANSRIIGVCYNNPMMHRYTFDKDLMTGERLQSF